MQWNLTESEIKNIEKENETTRRLNRTLWNHLTINASEQIDFVKNSKKSNFVRTRYLWNHWICSIPGINYVDFHTAETIING